jgi:hypothetical protein
MKFLIYILTALIFGFLLINAAIAIFNICNPWIGIGLGSLVIIVGIILLVKLIDHSIK